MPGYVATVVDHDGHELLPGQAGRLAIKGPTGCRYLDAPRPDDQRPQRLHGGGRAQPGAQSPREGLGRQPTTYRPASELQDFVKARIAPSKYPRAIEFVTELPKTAMAGSNASSCRLGRLSRFVTH